MKIRVFGDTLINGLWTGVGVGDFDPITAEHLISNGLAEVYETKVVEATEKKVPGLSQPAVQASPGPTVKKRRPRATKS